MKNENENETAAEQPGKSSRDKFEEKYPGLWEEIVALFGEELTDGV